MQKSVIVTKANHLIEAHYQLSLEEQRLICMLAAHISPHDDSFHEYSFRVRDIADLLGIADESYYTRVRDVVRTLMRRLLIIHKGTRTYEMTWVSDARYENGIVTLRFSDYLRPYLLQLKQCFTTYHLQMMLGLRSMYAMRLYELAKKNEKLGKYTYDIPSLRGMLGISPHQYSRWADFERYVLKSGVEEINKCTDVHIEYKRIKTGRKITSIAFAVKAQAIAPTIEAPIEALLNMVRAEARTPAVRSAIVRALEQHGLEYCRRNILYANNMAKTNYKRFLLLALDRDWGLLWDEDQGNINTLTVTHTDEDEQHIRDTQEYIDAKIRSMSPEELEARRQEIIRDKKLYLLFGADIPDTAWKVFLAEE